MPDPTIADFDDAAHPSDPEPRDREFRGEVLSHFNEPMLFGTELVRCVGYGEDEMDCYVVARRPRPHCDVIWITGVGGYVFLDRLKGQGHVVSTEGEEWDDLWRLSEDLRRGGAPREENPLVTVWEGPVLDAASGGAELDRLMTDHFVPGWKASSPGARTVFRDYALGATRGRIRSLRDEISTFRRENEGNLAGAFARSFPRSSLPDDLSLAGTQRKDDLESIVSAWLDEMHGMTDRCLEDISTLDQAADIRADASEPASEQRAREVARQMAIGENVLAEEAGVLRLLAPNDGGHPPLPVDCGCFRCERERRAAGIPWDGRIRYACEICGNKRCPHHTDHDLNCSGSNEPGQPGSDYGIDAGMQVPTTPSMPAVDARDTTVDDLGREVASLGAGRSQEISAELHGALSRYLLLRIEREPGIERDLLLRDPNLGVATEAPDKILASLCLLHFVELDPAMRLTLSDGGRQFLTDIW